MKPAFLFFSVMLSLGCFSQTQTSEEQNKVNNAIQRIKSENQSADTTKVIRFHCARTITKADEPLLIVDGVIKEMSYIKQINPDEIKAVVILKNEAAIKKYGKKAQYGVILVELKHPDAPPV